MLRFENEVMQTSVAQNMVCTSQLMLLFTEQAILPGPGPISATGAHMDTDSHRPGGDLVGRCIASGLGLLLFRSQRVQMGWITAIFCTDLPKIFYNM